MMKKIIFLISLVLPTFLGTACIADDFDDPFAVGDYSFSDNESSDMNLENVYFNPDASAINVKQFDIAGVMLGMSYEEINDLFFKGSGLYSPKKKNGIIYTINKDWKYNLDYECRQNNVVVPEKLEKCIYSLARDRGLLYVSEIHLERTYTGETIDIYLTSNATENLVWKIIYTNDADVMDGPSEKFENQREKKLLAFWQGVVDKYGTPNSGEDKWISSENAYDPMMQAFYGQLVLTDNGLNTSDSSENIQSARENFQAKPYAF